MDAYRYVECVKSKLSFTALSIKKFLNPFCFACTLGLLPKISTAKWQNIAGSKNFFN